MTAAILTAVYDKYDTLKPLRAQDTPHEAICITDDPDLHAEGWDVRYEPRPGLHPNRAAKRPKMCPWRYTDAETVIWIDASFQVTSWSLISDNEHLPFGMFSHPDRDCIYDEARVSMGMAKYAKEPIEEQAAQYRDWGHPEHWGLWATGFIARQKNENIEAFGESWLLQIEKWSFQDQVSQPVMLRDYDIRPDTIPGFYHQNPWLLFAASNRH